MPCMRDQPPRNNFVWHALNKGIESHLRGLEAVGQHRAEQI